MRITSKRAKLELEKLLAPPEVAQPIVLDGNFPAQNAFVNDPNRNIVAQCSRRAGKSNGLALRFFKTLAKYPKSQCIYLGLTQESAREIMWPVLQEINDKYQLGCVFVESKMIMKHPNGAKLKIMGADLKNFIKRLKGRKYPGIAIDEAQDFGTHLQSLVDDVLTPSTADYEDGWLALTGTPGPVPQGYFFEITQNRRFGYSFHEWTLLDNPHMPNPKAFIDEIKEKREWDDNNPTLLREYRNKWVLDVEALWIRYKEGLNHYTEMPKGEYNYILGIDIGFKDADALAVLAWSESDPNTYLVEELITSKQGLTELVDQVHEMYTKYKISKSVIDEGGLGKKLAEEMRRRHAIPVQAADKARKQENVELLNDHLRRSKFKAKSNSRFAQDSYLVQIDWAKSTPDRIIINKTPHSDIIDAVLYAFKESPAWTHKDVPTPPAYGSRAWAQAEQEKMFDQAMEHFEEQADIKKRDENGGFGD
jgi:hypothetical protein